jgi:PKD repeat protein
MHQEILGALRVLRRRYRWVVAVDRFLEFAFALTLLTGTLLLADRIAYELRLAEIHAARPAHVAAAFGLALGLAALAAPVAALVRRVPADGLAWRADKVLAADERILTSLEVARDGGSGFAPLLLAQTAEALRRADPRRIFPALPLGYRWGIGLAIGVGAFLAAFPARPHAPPPVAGFAVTPARGPAPLRVVAEDLSQGRIRERTWDFGDGTEVEGPLRTDHLYKVPGKYMVRLTVSGPGGSDTRTLDAPVEVLDPSAPFADFTVEPRKGRAPLDVRFRNYSRNAGRFAWSFGDGTTSTERDPVHRYEAPGLYTVALEARGESAADPIERRDLIKVVGPDAPLAAFRAFPTRGEAPLDVAFEDGTTGIAKEWEWDFGDRTPGADRTARERNPRHVYKMPGRYTVRLRVRGPGGVDTAVRVGYIEVFGDGSGGGGSGGGGPDERGLEPGKGGTPPPEGPPGKLFGDTPERPPVEFEDQTVKGRPSGEGMVEKEKNVYTGEQPSGAGGTPKTYGSVYGDYRRAAEDAMNREQVPPLLRDYVKRYFDRIRPR